MSVEERGISRLLDHVRVTAADASGLGIQISGGSDGALVFWLCREVYPGKTLGVHFGNRLRARSWFEHCGPVRYLDAPPICSDAEALRWALTASLCLDENRWPVGSRNRTEDILRSYSRSSIIATYLPIVGLWKSEVMSLCKYIGVPDEVLTSSRRADPECGRPIELADIGIERIDQFLKVELGLVDPRCLEAYGAHELAYLRELLKLNHFKAGLPHRGPTLDGLA